MDVLVFSVDNLKGISEAIEAVYPLGSLHRKIKKVAKNKAIFPNDQGLIKLVFPAVEEASKKWTFRHRDRAMIYSQLMIFFGDRLGKKLQ